MMMEVAKLTIEKAGELVLSTATDKISEYKEKNNGKNFLENLKYL